MSAETSNWYDGFVNTFKNDGYIEKAYDSLFDAGKDDWGNLTNKESWKSVGEFAHNVAPMAQAGLSYLAAKEENAAIRDKNNMLKAQYARQNQQQDTANTALSDGFNMAFYGDKKKKPQGLAGTLVNEAPQALTTPTA